MAMRRSLKISLRFYGPYKILQKIGQVTYKFELPLSLLIDPVFHVSNLKKLGQHNSPYTMLTYVIDNAIVQVVLEVNLDCRLVKRHGCAEVEVLVQWQGAGEDDAT